MSETKDTIVLVDVSAIAHAIWHTSETLTNRDQISANIVARVKALTSGFPYHAVCCDSGKSFRNDIDKNYKAQRPERDAGLHFQLKKALDRLRADGTVVWQIEGFEADDVIATATEQAVAAGHPVMIASTDKDLLQLVSPTVVAKSLIDGTIRDEAAVEAKYGVRPDQMRDYLTLVGDKSDNVPGAKGIGGVKASGLLKQFGILKSVYSHLDIAIEADLEKFPVVNADEDEYKAHCARVAKAIGVTTSVAQSLIEFKIQMPITRSLIQLRTDVPISIDVLLASNGQPGHSEQQSQELDDMPDLLDVTDIVSPTINTPDVAPSQTVQTPTQTAETGKLPPASPPPVVVIPPKPESKDETALAKKDEVLIVQGEVVYERQLDPRNMREAERMATILDKTGQFLSTHMNPAGIFAAIATGRELGFPTMASTRAIHVIEGKASMSAQAMLAKVLQSEKAVYFKPVSFSETEATWITLRKGSDEEPLKWTHTIEMARKAWPKKKPDWESSFLASGWGRNPQNMLIWRAVANLARLKYSDVLLGLYTPDEIEEMREAA